MESGEFVEWLGGIARLNPAQRVFALAALSEAERSGGVEFGSEGRVEAAGTLSSAVARDDATSTARERSDALGAIGDEKVAIEGCPHCADRRIIAWGRSNAMARYRCKACGRTFNALTKTPMAGLRNKERWLDHARAMLEGASVAKAAERCDVDYTTAFRWRHRFLGSPASDQPRTLSGIVEADETFILESFKGRRSGLPRPARKRGGKAKHAGLFFENIPILVARDRQGATVDAVLPNVDAASIKAVLDGVVTPANRFVCDGGKALVAFARRAKIPVSIVPAPGHPRPEAPDIHINNVNGYHGRLKEWLRRFHGVATKNLPHYLGWRRALEAWGTRATPERWILGAIGVGPYRQSRS